MEFSVDSFKAIQEKAQRISERRSVLKAQEESLLKQIKDLESSLVSEYGEDYIVKFEKAVSDIHVFDMGHADVS